MFRTSICASRIVTHKCDTKRINVFCRVSIECILNSNSIDSKPPISAVSMVAFVKVKMVCKRMTRALYCFFISRKDFSFAIYGLVEKDLRMIRMLYTLRYFLVSCCFIGKYVSDFTSRFVSVIFLPYIFIVLPFLSSHLFFSLYIYFVTENRKRVK